MSLYRCAACGSSKVISDEKSEGYSVTKGIVGVALFGTGGAVMGGDGNSKRYYHCRECGQTLTYPMPTSIKEIIDNAIADPAINKSTLEIEKKMYPNIEWESDEKIIEYKSNNELADAMIEFFEKTKIPFISEEKLEKILEIEPYGQINLFNACLLLSDRENNDISVYFNITKDCFYAYIPKSDKIEIFKDLVEYINKNNFLTEEQIKEYLLTVCKKKYIDFLNDEYIYKEFIKDLLKEKIKDDYIMVDMSYTCEYLTDNQIYIAIDKEKKAIQDEVRYKIARDKELNSKIIGIIENRQKIVLSELETEISNLLKEKDIYSNKTIEMYIFYLAKYRVIKLELKNDIKNSVVSYISEEEKRQERKELLERKRQERKKQEEIYEAELKKKEEKEKRVEKARLEDLKRIYLKDVIEALTPNKAMSGVELHKANSGLAKLSNKNLDDLMDLMRYLCDTGECKCVRSKRTGALLFYLANANVDEEILKNDIKINNDIPETKGNNIGGCYIATAVYGSYDCPEVWTLRRFRDYKLAKTWYGKAFIHTYYAISPTIVRWFGNTNWFKKIWRKKLDKLVFSLQSKGMENTPYKDKN